MLIQPHTCSYCNYTNFANLLGRNVPTLLINGHLDSGCKPITRKKRKASSISYPGDSTICKISGRSSKFCNSRDSSNNGNSRSRLRTNAAISCNDHVITHSRSNVAINSKQKESRVICNKKTVISNDTALIGKLHAELPGLYLVEVMQKINLCPHKGSRFMFPSVRC